MRPSLSRSSKAAPRALALTSMPSPAVLVTSTKRPFPVFLRSVLPGA